MAALGISTLYSFGQTGVVIPDDVRERFFPDAVAGSFVRGW
jgi:hypothetical protein